jgi:hypothetical protein
MVDVQIPHVHHEDDPAHDVLLYGLLHMPHELEAAAGELDLPGR